MTSDATKGRQITRIGFDLLTAMLTNNVRRGVTTNLPADAEIVAVAMDIRDQASRSCTVVLESAQWNSHPAGWEPVSFNFEFEWNEDHEPDAA